MYSRRMPEWTSALPSCPQFEKRLCNSIAMLFVLMKRLCMLTLCESLRKKKSNYRQAFLELDVFQQFNPDLEIENGKNEQSLSLFSTTVLFDV